MRQWEVDQLDNVVLLHWEVNTHVKLVCVELIVSEAETVLDEQVPIRMITVIVIDLFTCLNGSPLFIDQVEVSLFHVIVANILGNWRFVKLIKVVISR